MLDSKEAKATEPGVAGSSENNMVEDMEGTDLDDEDLLDDGNWYDHSIEKDGNTEAVMQSESSDPIAVHAPVGGVFVAANHSTGSQERNKDLRADTSRVSGRQLEEPRDENPFWPFAADEPVPIQESAQRQAAGDGTGQEAALGTAVSAAGDTQNLADKGDVQTAVPAKSPSVALGSLLDRALAGLKEKSTGGADGKAKASKPAPRSVVIQTPTSRKRRSKRRQGTVDEDSVERAGRLRQRRI